MLLLEIQALIRIRFSERITYHDATHDLAQLAPEATSWFEGELFFSHSSWRSFVNGHVGWLTENPATSRWGRPPGAVPSLVKER